MPEIVALNPADLLIDEENPRLSQPNSGQNATMLALARHLDKKLQVLATDIVMNGINPADLPIVTRFQRDANRYVVLEGNRRLLAIRSLENPEMFSDAIDRKTLAALRKLSKQYQLNPVELIHCVVVKDREEAEHWISLRHTGENDGAGIVRWSSLEAGRFKSRATGTKMELHVQALNFLEARGALPPDIRKAVPATSFKRLIETPAVREKLGIELENGLLKLLADAKQVTKALRHVVDDLATKKLKVGDIYSKKDRVSYAENLPPKVVVTPTKPSGQGVAVSLTTTRSAKKTKARIAPKKRDHLIPVDCALDLVDQRLINISEELRSLSLEKYTNAVSVMFRVFLELNVDEYIRREKLPSPNSRTPLDKKIGMVLKELLKKQKLTSAQATPVRRAIQKDSFLATTIDAMHAYVHNVHFSPGPSDLRVGWDNLQPFIVAISRP